MPLVSRTFDQLIDFTRTSAGTFVGSNGLIQSTPASRNLLTFTQEFDNAAWTKTAATVTANSTAAPDGTMTADKLVETAAAGTHLAAASATVLNATVYTASVFVKAAERTFVGLYAGTPGQGTVFNLTTGAVHGSLVAPPTSSSITNVGNGWYRISITYTSTATSTQPSVYVCDGTGAFSYTGDGTSGIFAWGAQVEQASTATDYTRNFGGLFPPRFDFDPVTLAPRGLLIEEQRTNLLTYSAQFDNAAWTDASPTETVTVAVNDTTAPDGTSSADKLTAATGGTNAMARQVKTLVASTAYTGSIFVKASTATQSRMLLRDTTAGTNFADATITWTAGVPSIAGGATGTWTVTSVGNGWFRVTGAGSTGGTASPAVTFSLFPDTAAGTNAIFAWGAQLEAGAFATSYIPTVASQVTRTADIATINAPNFAPWYRADEGTFVVEFDTAKPTTETSTVPHVFQAANAAQNNTFDLVLFSDSGLGRVITGGSAVGDASHTYIAGVVNKFAFAARTNDFALARTGSAVATDTAGVLPSDFSQIAIGSSASQGSQLNGHIRSIRYYPVRLSNAQLQALTA